MSIVQPALAVESQAELHKYVPCCTEDDYKYFDEATWFRPSNDSILVIDWDQSRTLVLPCQCGHEHEFSCYYFGASSASGFLIQNIPKPYSLIIFNNIPIISHNYVPLISLGLSNFPSHGHRCEAGKKRLGGLRWEPWLHFNTSRSLWCWRGSEGR